MDMPLGLKSWKSVVWLAYRSIRPDIYIYVQRNTIKIFINNFLFWFTSVFWRSWGPKSLVRTQFYDSIRIYEFNKYYVVSWLQLILTAFKIIISNWLKVRAIILVFRAKSSFNSISSRRMFKLLGISPTVCLVCIFNNICVAYECRPSTNWTSPYLTLRTMFSDLGVGINAHLILPNHLFEKNTHSRYSGSKNVVRIWFDTSCGVKGMQGQRLPVFGL